MPRGITRRPDAARAAPAGAKPGEPRREVDRQLNRSTGPVSSMVSASSGVRVAGSRARNHGENVSTSIDVAGQVERVEPDHPRAAVVAVLVVGDVHVDVVAGVVGQHGARRTASSGR